MNFCEHHPNVPAQYFYKDTCILCAPGPLLYATGPVARTCFLYAYKLDRDPREFEHEVLIRYNIGPHNSTVGDMFQDPIHRRLYEFILHT